MTGCSKEQAAAEISPPYKNFRPRKSRENTPKELLQCRWITGKLGENLAQKRL
jgi:hypothetical protein